MSEAAECPVGQEECQQETAAKAAAILRRTSDTKLEEMSTRITGLETSHTEMKQAISENTTITKQIADSTSGLVEAWAAISGGLKVLNFLGKVAKWVTYIAGMIAAVYTAWHLRDGGPPL